MRCEIFVYNIANSVCAPDNSGRGSHVHKILLSSDFVFTFNLCNFN